MVYELSNMPWWEAEEKLKESKLVIVPVGATEQHGLHLGLGADWIQAWTFANKVGKKTGRPIFREAQRDVFKKLLFFFLKPVILFTRRNIFYEYFQ